MTSEGYPESALVTNRTSTIVYGGSEAERRAWAEEAAGNFEAEGSLRCADDDVALTQAFAATRGVVFVPDISRIGITAQGELVRILREREERPKFVIGLRSAPVAARDQGLIRWDLAYALHRATVNLDDSGMADRIKVRRARAPKRAAAVIKVAPKRAVAAKTAKTTKTTKVAQVAKAKVATKRPIKRPTKPAKPARAAGRRR